MINFIEKIFDLLYLKMLKIIGLINLKEFYLFRINFCLKLQFPSIIINQYFKI